MAAAPPITVSSPDGRVRIEFDLSRAGDDNKVPRYRVLFRDTEVIGPSRLGIVLGDESTLGGPCEVAAVETHSRHETYEQFPGKRRKVTDHCAEAVIRLRELAGINRKWEIVVRAYDDGVAFRYRFPAQPGWDKLVIAREQTEFSVPPAARAFALPLNGFTTSYEKLYQVTPAGELPKDWLLGLPLLLEYRGGVWAGITEANVTEYAGLYLAPAGGGNLAARLSPLPNEPKVAVRAALPGVSPWRVVMVGDRVGRLIESDLVLNLSAPRAIEDTSWIKPGKTTFPWWNGYYEENVAFKPGLNTPTMKHYIDFCAEAGIPYHSLDGLGNTAWYSGPIVPYEGAPPTKAVAGLDLPEVLKHANAKGVRLRLWMHWKAAESHMQRAFPLYREWGIEGVMLDFMDRDDQEMNAFVRQ
ncbi:MAG TPA: glycoside hydrolase family 97 N-terminal domain-containing protein, partial [Gemmataceae bacterium]|nr:glycoside hydrolase family 97 N-terminal domain-containing protein [Gemmataceae bacterium]